MLLNSYEINLTKLTRDSQHQNNANLIQTNFIYSVCVTFKAQTF